VAVNDCKLRSHGGRSGHGLFTDEAWHGIALALGIAPRELEIVRRIFDDRTEADIARELGISPHTVHTYLARIYNKLHVASRVQLVVRVVQQQNAAAIAPTVGSSRPTSRRASRAQHARPLSLSPDKLKASGTVPLSQMLSG
jgi:DNA-binding CsgD family transcriptional regulator